MAHEAHGPVTLQALSGRLAELSNVPRDRVAEFVWRAVDSGLLVPAPPVPEQTRSILLDTAHFLEGYGFDRHRVPDTLREIETELRSTCAAGHPGRLREWERVQDQVVELSKVFGTEFPRSSVIYEDTGVPEMLTVPKMAWQPVLATLQTLLPALEAFDVNHAWRNATRLVFTRHYGVGGICKDVVAFSQHMGEIYTIAQELIAQKSTGSAAIDRVREEILADVQEGVRNGSWEVDVDTDKLAALASDEDYRAALPEWASYSCFLQAQLDRDGRLVAVVNHLYGGLGRYFSRYERVLGSNLVEKMRGRLNDFFGARQRVLKLRPVRGFNANLHELVAEEEIRVDPVGQGVAVTELELRHNARSDTLGICVVSGDSPVHVVYLGFLIPPRPSSCARRARHSGERRPPGVSLLVCE